MCNINDIKTGDTLWYSKQGEIGQIRVFGIDKDNNKLKFKSSDNKVHDIEISNDIYDDPQAAIDAARNYNNIYVKGIKQGMFGTQVVYNTPSEVDDKYVKQMLLD
jgi:hypothetical protein